MFKKHPTFFSVPKGNGSHAHGLRLLRLADETNAE